MCDFNGIFQKREAEKIKKQDKTEQPYTLIKDNAYSEFEILFDNNINDAWKNGKDNRNILRGYEFLFLIMNKYF